MKTSGLASLCLAVAVLLPAFTSCKSDESPFNISVINSGNNATIQLRLNVEETRAGGMATDAEMEIKKVLVHVFNEKQQLEITKPVTVASGTNTVNLEVSHGLKTIYVVSAKSNVNPAVGISITDYENQTFNSSLANLKTDDGFVMVGKSEEQQVMNSASQDDLPSSNIFDITLVRLVAKAQVKCSNVNGSGFGISFGNASFKACQLSERMRVVHNGSDVFASFVDGNNNGTYDYYSLREQEAYSNVTASDFSADGCEYMSENIVAQPQSGNTTYLSVRFATTPNKYYTFDSATSSVKESTEVPAASTTYYTVGILDKANGLVDYAVYNGTKNILTFKTLEDAGKYLNSVSAGNASAITLSQIDRPLSTRAGAEATSDSPQFEVVTFDQGYVYYRVNIAHQSTSGDSNKSTFKVMRNKFYKVNINSVSNLGFNSEALLRPTNPAAKLDAQGHSYISASISVAPWDEVDQIVNL